MGTVREESCKTILKGARKDCKGSLGGQCSRVLVLLKRS
jgi:hypothetical protein